MSGSLTPGSFVGERFQRVPRSPTERTGQRIRSWEFGRHIRHGGMEQGGRTARLEEGPRGFPVRPSRSRVHRPDPYPHMSTGPRYP